MTQAGAFFIIKSQEKHNPKRNQAVIKGGIRMFYNKRKTIGVFLNRAELEFQQVLSRSLTETAKQCDYNIVFLTSFGIRETETMYDLYKEKKVKKARR